MKLLLDPGSSLAVTAGAEFERDGSNRSANHVDTRGLADQSRRESDDIKSRCSDPEVSSVGEFEGRGHRVRDGNTGAQREDVEDSSSGRGT